MRPDSGRHDSRVGKLQLGVIHCRLGSVHRGLRGPDLRGGGFPRGRRPRHVGLGAGQGGLRSVEVRLGGIDILLGYGAQILLVRLEFRS